MFDNWYHICHCFPRSSFSDSNNISPWHHKREGLCLNRKRTLIFSLLYDLKYLITEPTLIPVENRVRYIFASYFNISCLFPILINLFFCQFFNFFRFSVKIKPYLFILNLRMINGIELFPFGQLLLFIQKVIIIVFLCLIILLFLFNFIYNLSINLFLDTLFL